MDERRHASGDATYNNDEEVFDLFSAICVGEAGNRTWQEKTMGAGEMDESIALNLTKESVEIAILKFKKVSDGGVWPDGLTADMVLNEGYKKAEDGGILIPGNKLVVRYKKLRAYVRNACLPAYSSALTKSTMEIPSGKQLKDILDAVVNSCWEEKERERLKNLTKSRERRAKAQSDDKAPPKKLAADSPKQQPPTWLPEAMGLYAHCGDLAARKEANFVLEVAAVHGPRGKGRSTTVDLSDEQTGKEPPAAKYSRRAERARQTQEKTAAKKAVISDTQRLMSSNLQMQSCMMKMALEKDLQQQELDMADAAIAIARELKMMDDTEENREAYKEALLMKKVALQNAQAARALAATKMRADIAAHAR